MSTLRRIVIDKKEYLWKYTFDDYDYQNDSSLIIKSADKKGKLMINFKTGKWDIGYCPFNKGVQAIYKNNAVIINLNQPRFIMEIASYVINKLKIDSLSETIVLNNGIQILHEMGYQFEYNKSWNG